MTWLRVPGLTCKITPACVSVYPCTSTSHLALQASRKVQRRHLFLGRDMCVLRGENQPLSPVPVARILRPGWCPDSGLALRVEYWDQAGRSYARPFLIRGRIWRRADRSGSCSHSLLSFWVSVHLLSVLANWAFQRWERLAFGFLVRLKSGHEIKTIWRNLIASNSAKQPL